MQYLHRNVEKQKESDPDCGAPLTSDGFALMLFGTVS
jgi:hypothetical protein